MKNYNPTSVSEVLADAADYIATNGHHKGAAFAEWDMAARHPVPGSPACALGALQAVCRATTDKRGRHWLDSVMALCRSIPDGVTPPDWNDAPERTAEDVILHLKHLAAGEVPPDARP